MESAFANLWKNRGNTVIREIQVLTGFFSVRANKKKIIPVGKSWDAVAPLRKRKPPGGGKKEPALTFIMSAALNNNDFGVFNFIDETVVVVDSS